MWASVLAEATSVLHEVTIDSGALAVEACSNLVTALENLAYKSALDELQQITQGMAASVGNVVGSLNGIKNTTNSTENLLIDSFNVANSLLDRLTGLLSVRLGLGQLIEVKSSQVEMRVMKMSADKVGGNVSNEVVVPGLCEMIGGDCGPYRAVVIQAKVGAVAPGVAGSGTVGLSLSNEDNSVISVGNSTRLISVKVPRPVGFSLPEFEVVNVSNSSRGNSSSEVVLVTRAFRVSVPMSAVFVQVRPGDLGLGYFLWVNRGGVPLYNATVKRYERIKAFCPFELRAGAEGEAGFYQFFMNMNETSNFTGVLGVGVREMVDEEFRRHCVDGGEVNGTSRLEPVVDGNIKFTADFGLRSFTGNCLFFDEETNKWASEGVEMLEDTDHEYTHW